MWDIRPTVPAFLKAAQQHPCIQYLYLSRVMQHLLLLPAPPNLSPPWCSINCNNDPPPNRTVNDVCLPTHQANVGSKP